MKLHFFKKFVCVFVLQLLTTSFLFSQTDDQQNISFEFSGSSNVPSASLDRKCFWTFEGEGDWISRSSFTTPEDRGQKIGYSESELYLSFTRLLNSCEGVGVGVGYSRTHVGWNENPYFERQNFDDITFSIEGFSKRFCNWDWKGSISIDMQTLNFGDGDYNTYNLLAWGRYSFHNCYFNNLGLHIGVVGRTGMEQTIAWPILGFDFRLKPNWKLNIVYPVNMSLVYTLSDSWSIAFAGRIWNSRHRVSKSENLPRGIFEYRNTGAEVALNYEYNDSANASLHIGSTLGSGDLKVISSQNHTVSHNKFRAAAYLGGAFNLKF